MCGGCCRGALFRAPLLMVATFRCLRSIVGSTGALLSSSFATADQDISPVTLAIADPLIRRILRERGTSTTAPTTTTRWSTKSFCSRFAYEVVARSLRVRVSLSLSWAAARQTRDSMSATLTRTRTTSTPSSNVVDRTGRAWSFRSGARFMGR